jgi:hypothetical protein
MPGTALGDSSHPKPYSFETNETLYRLEGVLEQDGKNCNYAPALGTPIVDIRESNGAKHAADVTKPTYPPFRIPEDTRDGGIDAPAYPEQPSGHRKFHVRSPLVRGAQRRREQESGESTQETSKGFAQNPAPTAPHNRIPLPSSNGESDFRSGRRLMQKQQPHQLAANAYAGAKTRQTPCFFHLADRGKQRDKGPHREPFSTLCLLLRRTFLPPTELERARNPIFRFLGLLCG